MPSNLAYNTGTLLYIKKRKYLPTEYHSFLIFAILIHTLHALCMNFTYIHKFKSSNFDALREKLKNLQP